MTITDKENESNISSEEKDDEDLTLWAKIDIWLYCYWKSILVITIIISIIISIGILTYITIVYTLQPIFKFTIKEIVSLITPLITIISIFVASSTAIFVMKRNQKHQIKLENEKIKIEDKKVEELRDITFLDMKDIINLILNIYIEKNESQLNSESEVYKEELIELYSNLNEICNNINKLIINNRNENSIRAINVNRDIKKHSRLIITRLKFANGTIDRKHLLTVTNKMYNLIYDYLKESPYVTDIPELPIFELYKI